MGNRVLLLGGQHRGELESRHLGSLDVAIRQLEAVGIRLNLPKQLSNFGDVREMYASLRRMRPENPETLEYVGRLTFRKGAPGRYGTLIADLGRLLRWREIVEARRNRAPLFLSVRLPDGTIQQTSIPRPQGKGRGESRKDQQPGKGSGPGRRAGGFEGATPAGPTKVLHIQPELAAALEKKQVKLLPFELDGRRYAVPGAVVLRFWRCRPDHEGWRLLEFRGDELVLGNRCLSLRSYQRGR